MLKSSTSQWKIKRRQENRRRRGKEVMSFSRVSDVQPDAPGRSPLFGDEGHPRKPRPVEQTGKFLGVDSIAADPLELIHKSTANGK
jgi:hypothetical protein